MVYEFLMGIAGLLLVGAFATFAYLMLGADSRDDEN